MEGFDDPIRAYQQRLRDLMDKAERLRPCLKACQDAIARAGAKVSAHIGARDTSHPTVDLMMFVKRLDETIPVFRELAKEGLHVNKDAKPEDRDLFGVIGMREYRLGPDCRLVAMLAGQRDGDDGKSCRLQQTGTKEVPVYEIVCEE